MLKHYNNAINRAEKALQLAKETTVLDIKLSAMKMYHRAMNDANRIQKEMKNL